MRENNMSVLLVDLTMNRFVLLTLTDNVGDPYILAILYKVNKTHALQPT
jgi:hypothetical protein